MKVQILMRTFSESEWMNGTFRIVQELRLRMSLIVVSNFWTSCKHGVHLLLDYVSLVAKSFYIQNHHLQSDYGNDLKLVLYLFSFRFINYSCKYSVTVWVDTRPFIWSKLKIFLDPIFKLFKMYHPGYSYVPFLNVLERSLAFMNFHKKKFQNFQSFSKFFKKTPNVQEWNIWMSRV